MNNLGKGILLGAIGVAAAGCCLGTGVLAGRKLINPSSGAAIQQVSEERVPFWKLEKISNYNIFEPGYENLTETPVPTATPIYCPTIQPTSTPGCVPIPTQQCSSSNSVEECQQNVLATLHPVNYGVPEEVKGDCLEHVEYCIDDAIMLSQQRLTQLGLYKELKDLADVPADKDVYRAFFNFSQDGADSAYELYVEFGDGQTHSLHRVPLSAEMMKSYIDRTGGYSIESTIRNKDVFESDILNNGHSIDELAALLSSAPDTSAKGYSLEGWKDALKNKPLAWYVFAPNKLPCADGSNAPGLFTVVEMKDGKVMEYPLNFQLDDQMLDQAMKMSEAHYSY